MALSVFTLSQLLVAVAIGFDLLSFQFKERRRIIACLVVSCLLVALHFALFGHWTATGLGLLAGLRFATSLVSTSKKLMVFFILTSLAVAVLTFDGILTVLSCLGSMFGTIASFCRTDKDLRRLLLIATSLWLVHNCLAGSPTAVLMEGLFITSNLIGYYRYYGRRRTKPAGPP